MSDGSNESLPDEDTVVRRVGLLVSLRRFGEARLALSAALPTYPENSRLLYFSAFVDWVEDRNDDARATVQQLLGLYPDDYAGRSLLAHIQEDAGQLPDAELTWIALLREYPDDTDLCGHYADLMLRTLHVEKARQLAHSGLRGDPEHVNCLYVAAMCDLVDGRSLSANSGIVELVRQHPEHVRTGLALVSALEDSGDHRAALKVAQQLLRADPASPRLLALVQHFRRRTHWSMLPLYPIQRWGWPAALGLWAVVAFGLPLVAPSLPASVSRGLAVTWLVYVVYSWVWPPLSRRILG